MLDLTLRQPENRHLRIIFYLIGVTGIWVAAVIAFAHNILTLQHTPFDMVILWASFLIMMLQYGKAVSIQTEERLHISLIWSLLVLMVCSVSRC